MQKPLGPFQKKIEKKTEMFKIVDGRQSVNSTCYSNEVSYVLRT